MNIYTTWRKLAVEWAAVLPLDFQPGFLKQKNEKKIDKETKVQPSKYLRN